MELENILREAGLENRMEILRMLRDKPATVSEVKLSLRKMGVSKPYITVSRYLENLKREGLLSERDGKFYLSIAGRLLLSYLDEIEEKLDVIGRFWEHLRHPIDYLPEEFIRRIDVLQHARVLTDQYSIILETLKGLQMAEEEVLVIAGTTVSSEYVLAGFKRSLEGIREKIINDASIVEQDKVVYLEAVRKLKLNDKDVRKIKKNRKVRKYDNLVLRIMVVDDRMAGISLPEAGRSDMIVPSFQSENKEFIAWVKDIFQWYWERATPVEW
jgi:predicted transcriptional regulator